MKRSTLYDILGRYEKRKTTERKMGSGRTAHELPASKRRWVRQAANNKKCQSQKLAARFNVRRAYVYRESSQKPEYKIFQETEVPRFNSRTTNITNQMPQVHESKLVPAHFKCG